MAHSKEAHAKMPAMGKFNEGHWEKKMSDVSLADGKYSTGEMNQHEEYTKDVDALANYAKKHKMKY
jgi:hypothetical protein